jgi:membrane complex biogenesis BtpA family protein
MDHLEERVVAETSILRDAGFDGCVIENYGDSPFYKEVVEPVTVAALARLVAAACRATPGFRIGVNVLRNDARAALSIAAACGARFVRVNVHVGATATDQGVIEGRAAETLRLRRALGAPIEIWADVHVKHGRSLAHTQIEREAEDAVQRGQADALIVSGTGTGTTPELEDVRRVADAKLGVPVLIGSGVTDRSVSRFLEFADGVIVGTGLKVDGVTTGSLDADLARRFVAAARSRG